MRLPQWLDAGLIATEVCVGHRHGVAIVDVNAGYGPATTDKSYRSHNTPIAPRRQRLIIGYFRVPWTIVRSVRGRRRVSRL